jgi:uncharacterized protein YcbK (DUF882 family)
MILTPPKIGSVDSQVLADQVSAFADSPAISPEFMTPIANPTTTRGVSRRGFLAGMAVAGLGMVRVPRLVAAVETPRSLSFRHLHTREQLTVQYYRGGQYLPGALHDVNHCLRDWRTNQVHPIDPELLDLLSDLHQASGSRMPFDVICGYRSPATNKMLAGKSENVSPRSLHLQGKAIDIRLGDVPLEHLRDTAKKLKRGGVGFYRASNFVHVDTGRVRAW